MRRSSQFDFRREEEEEKTRTGICSSRRRKRSVSEATSEREKRSETNDVLSVVLGLLDDTVDSVIRRNLLTESGDGVVCENGNKSFQRVGGKRGRETRDEWTNSLRSEDTGRKDVREVRWDY